VITIVIEHSQALLGFMGPLSAVIRMDAKGWWYPSVVGASISSFTLENRSTLHVFG